MRVTKSMYYNNIEANNSKLNKALFDVNKQISSGQQIQYAHEDPDTFINTVRLDNEITTFTQVQKSADNGFKFSAQTDTALVDMQEVLEAMKVKFVNAANESHSSTSLQAIAKDLRGLEQQLLSLANTSISGKYLFSGTAVTTKPIGTDGSYQGNDEYLKATLGSGVEQSYNITGAQLFSGEESQTQRRVTMNTPSLNLAKLHPEIMQNITIPETGYEEVYITESDTIRDLMGDDDAVIDTVNAKHFFYLQGTRHDGSTFKAKYDMRDDETVGALLGRIADEFGGSDVVDVSLNQHGEIEITDRLSGSSKLDFHMVAATDFSGGTDADVTDIDDLDIAGVSTDYETAATGGTLYVREFIRSGMSNPVGMGIEGVIYDRTNFAEEGQFLRSDVPQIVAASNAYATDSTKLADVFAHMNSTLHVSGNRIDGTAFSIDVNLNASPVTVSGDYAYTVLDAEGNNTDPADMTYRQLMDIVNMAMNDEDPTLDYDQAIRNANQNSSVTLSDTGTITFQEFDATDTLASLSMYDNASDDYSVTTGAMAAFNANSALTISDPKTDFFAQIDAAIRAVEEERYRPDGTSGDPTNIGIQNAIQIADDLAEHVGRLQAQAGANSNTLQNASDRMTMLMLNSEQLRSEFIDTDIAEATLQLQQLSLNYQALLSTVSRVSELSLVNYL